MQNDLDYEKRAMERVWKKREVQIRKFYSTYQECMVSYKALWAMHSLISKHFPYLKVVRKKIIKNRFSLIWFLNAVSLG